jgi:regulatory protein
VIRQQTLRERALRLLAGREHSRLELQRKLAPLAASPDELEALLDELVRSRLLSDDRYAEARGHTLSRRFGSLRVAHELKRQGIAEAPLAAAVAAARSNELERARQSWRKRFGEAPRNAQERAKQMRFLQNRGYTMDVIRSVLGRADGDDPSFAPSCPLRAAGIPEKIKRLSVFDSRVADGCAYLCR